MKTIYLCGPIAGLTYPQAAFGWRQKVRDNPRMKQLVEDREVRFLDPLRGKSVLGHFTGPLTGDTPLLPDQPLLSDNAIVRRDRNDVRSSDLVLAYFRDGVKTSVGSMVEFGWADAHGVPIVAVLDRYHNHLFTRELATAVCGNLDEAVAAAISVLGLE